MGLCYNIAFIFLFEYRYPENDDIALTAQIISMQFEKEKSNKYIVKVLYCEKYKKTKNTKLIVYIDKNYNLKPGDIVYVKGEFEKGSINTNYKGFNYRNYLKQYKIYGILYVENVQIIKNKKTFYTEIMKIRGKISKIIDEIYVEDDENYSQFLQAILIGNKEKLDEEIKDNFKNASISHILAISGMHVTYVVMVFKILLSKIDIHKKTKNYIICLLVICYGIISGGEASCIRACIMSILIILSFNFERKSDTYINIIVSFFILIILNPFNITNVGMWLSFAGTLGIVLFNNIILKFFQKRFKNLFYSKLFSIFSLSISAQILMFPIILYEFNYFSLNFIVSNFLVSFVIGPCLILGYISLISHFFKMPFIINIEKKLIKAIYLFTNFLSKNSFLKFYFKTPNICIIFFYYLFIFLIVFLFNTRKILFYKLMFSSKIKFKNIRKMIIKKIFVITIIVLFIFYMCSKIYFMYFSNLRISFVDVGQGDCTVITTMQNKTILIDGGNNIGFDYGKKTVLPYLLDRGVTKIDYVIISHFDSDHVGGIYAILKELDIGQIIIGKQFVENPNLELFMDIVKNKKINVRVAKKGDKIFLENRIWIDVLWPDSNCEILENSINNNALVFKLNYLNTNFSSVSILFTGDVEKEAEEKLVQEYKTQNTLSSQILKVGHHGSKSSSTQNFLEFVSPKVCLIGVGKDNKFGHPNEEVIERLEDMKCKILRTDQDGEINIFINRKGEITIKKFLK